MAGFHDLNLFQGETVAVFDNDPTGGEPVAQNFLQGFSHRRGTLPSPSDYNSPEALQRIRSFAYPEPIANPFHVAPDRFLGVNGLKPGHKDCFKCFPGILIHAHQP